jgi:hypothetical protein
LNVLVWHHWCMKHMLHVERYISIFQSLHSFSQVSSPNHIFSIHKTQTRDFV